MAAALAALGLLVSTVVVLTASSGPAGAVAGYELDVTKTSGTLPHGVEWEANGPPNSFGVSAPPTTRTITFSQPVNLTFSLRSVQCANEGVQLPADVVPVEIHPNHTWDPGAGTLFSRPGAIEDDESRFTFYGFVDELSVTAIGTEVCNRALTHVLAGLPVPFACEVSTIFLAQGQPGTQLNILEYGGGEGTFVPVGAPRTPPHNSLAYHPDRGLLYAVDTASHLIVIDSAGDVIDLGPTPVAMQNHNIGAIGPDGRYYTMFWLGTTLHRIDLDTMTTDPLVLTAAPEAADLTFLEGRLWGFDSSPRSLVRVDPVTGQVDRFAAPEIQSNGAGGAWTFANGNLGLSDNTTGTIWQIAITDPNGESPTFEVVSAAPGPPSAFNDGTSCESPPTDLALEKSVDPDLLAGDTTLTWTLTIRNDGPHQSSGYVVTDTLPADVTDITSDTPGCAVEGQVVTCTGAALGVGEERQVVITGSVGSDVPSVTNDAVLIGNEDDPDPSDNTAQVTARRPVGVCFARALGLPLGLYLGRANPAQTPCTTEEDWVLQGSVLLPPDMPSILKALQGGVKVTGLVAATTADPTRYEAVAHVVEASITLPVLGIDIEAKGIHSSAASSLTSCAAPPTVEHDSRIATLRVGGRTIVVGDRQMTVPLLVGALHLNHEKVVGSTIMRRTLFLDLPGTALDVTIGETKAGITC